MPLPIGTWTAVVNGSETPLRIDPPDQQGIFTGQIFSGRIKGFWNESAQKIQFASFAEAGQGNENPLFGIFEGYLFRVPSNAQPGRDVTATLVGSLAASAQLGIKKANLDYFTNETFQVAVRIEWPALRLIDVKIAGGQLTGDDAEISVQGTMLLQREEPTGDIVEVDRYPAKGTVKLQRKDGVWRYAGTEKLER